MSDRVNHVARRDPTSMAVVILGLALILSLAMIGAGWLLEVAHPVPDVLVASSAGALSGLLGLLAPRPALLGGEHRA